MSEYIEIGTEETDDPDTLRLVTNIRLTDGEAQAYDSAESMALGAPLAQLLAAVPGIRRLRLEEHNLWLTREPEAEWYWLVEDVSSVLKEFFL